MKSPGKVLKFFLWKLCGHPENIKVFFETVNKELHFVNNWFLANKLSLNTEKTKYLCFHKPSTCDSILLRLLTINFSSIEIKCESSAKFL